MTKKPRKPLTVFGSEQLIFWLWLVFFTLQSNPLLDLFQSITNNITIYLGLAQSTLFTRNQSESTNQNNFFTFLLIAFLLFTFILIALLFLFALLLIPFLYRFLSFSIVVSYLLSYYTIFLLLSIVFYCFWSLILTIMIFVMEDVLMCF